MSFPESHPMLTVTTAPYRLVLRESLGLSHEEQVIEIPIPDSSADWFFLREEGGGRLFPVQASRQKPGHGYLLIAVEPHREISLVMAEGAEEPRARVEIADRDGNGRLENGCFEIELLAGGQVFAPGFSRPPLPGPVVRMRPCQGRGAWRGGTFIDTSLSPLRWKAEWLEWGPLRAAYRYRVEFPDAHFYQLVLTADAGSDFARLEETFHMAASDQIVWDFSGDDLPDRLSLLDSTAGYRGQRLHYHYDRRQARLWGWTQFSQLHDLSDGFALRFPGADDVVGVVALEGGAWNGNALNHLEAWTRRWETDDRGTRRLPAEAKADGFPGPERIPARGESRCRPHFTLEGWLRRGCRRFALVLSEGKKIEPLAESPSDPEAQGCSPALGHFEEVPDRPRYRAQQGRLRQIHTQHGLIPLQDQLAMTFAWPLEPVFREGHAPSPGQREALRLGRFEGGTAAFAGDPDRIRELDQYLEARIFGFWEGSGSAYSNCVVGRRIGPEMLRVEELAQQGKIDGQTLSRWRAWFAFLAYLNASENFYPGPATMGAVGTEESTEPTLAGMANQNFYTDVIALFGYAGQVFAGHPRAAFWAGRFLAHWREQLGYHVYPGSGLWEESHTYYQHVLATVLPLLLRRRADGAGDAFAEAALQKLVAGALPQLTPPDAVIGGFRHLVAFGDHGADVLTYRHLYAEYARAFAPHDPRLARQLAWACLEMGGEGVSEIVPLQPAWNHGPIEGLGFFFRGADAAGRENLLALRSGAAWGHHHNDEGSIQFFAHGRAMIVDSACSRPQERRERKVAASGHSRCEIEGAEPLNYLWRFNRGWILDAHAGDEKALAHAVAGVPTYCAWPGNLEPQLFPRPFWELRAVVELAPEIYLVADYLDPSQRHFVRFHVAHPEVRIEGTAVTAIFGEDCHLRIVPLREVRPPVCSLDRPLSGAAEEITTAVEYAGISGPWSLFVVAAFPGESSRLSVTGDRKSWEIGCDGKRFAVSVEADQRLRVESGSGAGAAGKTTVIIPELLLASLRAE